MKPYGSKRKRSLDTEPRIKSGRALVKREGAEHIGEELRLRAYQAPLRGCKHCGGTSERDELYDAYFCRACDMWLEKMCEDPSSCEFCKNRPDTPSGVRKPLPWETW